MFIQAMNMLVQRWDFFGNLLLEHIIISSIAILYATAIGLITGVLISEYRKASKVTLAIVNLLYTIPSLALLGLLIPYTGVGDVTAIIALTVYGLLPMVKNTYTGLTNVDPAIVEAAKGMGSTRRQTLFNVKFLLALPVIMTGFRNMVTMTIAVTTIASFIGAGGLGVAIYRGITTNNMPMVLAGSILVALLAITVDLILGAVEKRQYRAHTHGRNRKTVIIAATIIVVFVGYALGVAIQKTADSGSAKTSTVTVASKSYTEELVLGQILSQYIEGSTDLNVNLVEGLGGGTSTIQPGLLTGNYDIYPEYTGTAWNNVLQAGGIYHEDQFNELQSQYNDMGLTWAGTFGFNDTYGIAVKTSIAEKYNLKTYSDLKGVAEKLTVGAEYDFYDRPDGYYALCDYYGFKFGSTMDLDTGLKYKAIASGDVDALIIYTTDGQLADSDVTILQDDLEFFPSYSAGTVARQEVLDAHPELKDAISNLQGKIDEETMTYLNHEVDINGRDPSDVAHEFLTSSGLL